MVRRGMGDLKKKEGARVADDIVGDVRRRLKPGTVYQQCKRG